jgi:hypothetical protein
MSAISDYPAADQQRARALSWALNGFKYTLQPLNLGPRIPPNPARDFNSFSSAWTISEGTNPFFRSSLSIPISN